jgi:hypothetical protein
MMPTLAVEKSSNNEFVSDSVAALPPERGAKFWMAMVCIMLSTFLAALDTVSQSRDHLPLVALNDVIHL